MLAITNSTDQDLEALKKAAEAGYASAQFELGKRYYTGKGLPQNNAEAFRLFLLAVQQKIPGIGIKNISDFLFSHGLQNPHNFLEAFHWYMSQKPISLSFTVVIFLFLHMDLNHLASFLHKQKSTESEQKIYNLFCCKVLDGVKKQDSIAQHVAGRMYLFGIWIEKDEREAFKCLSASEEQGNVDAAFLIAQMHLNGVGTEKNAKLAFTCFYRLAEKGYFYAILQLAKLYLEGIGTDQDKKKAFECYACAAISGHPLPQLFLGRMFLEGIGTDKNEDKAFQYFSWSATKGSTDALLEIAKCHLHGLGTKASEKMASEYFRKHLATTNNTAGINYLKQLAEKNDSAALKILGDLYYQLSEQRLKVLKAEVESLNTTEDTKNQINITDQADDARTEALQYYSKAATAGHLLAAKSLYQRGFYQEKIQSLIVLRNLTGNGNNKAKTFLARALVDFGIAHLYGTIVEKDEEKAFNFISRAEEYGNNDAVLYLAKMYLLGIGTKKSQKKAAEYFNKVFFYENLHKKPEDNLNYLHELAEKNDPTALYILGFSYKYSYNNKTTALEYYSKSALAGNLLSAKELLLFKKPESAKITGFSVIQRLAKEGNIKAGKCLSELYLGYWRDFSFNYKRIPPGMAFQKSTKKGLKWLQRTLTFSVTKLDLYEVNVTPEDIPYLKKFLSRNQHITHIDLYACSLSDDAHALLEVLEPHRNITSLRVGDMNEEGLDALAKLNALISLDYLHSELSVADTIHKLILLTSNLPLIYLNLSDNRISIDPTTNMLSQEFESFVTALSLMPKLGWLKLNKNELGTLDAPLLSNILLKDNVHLKSLFLNANQINDEGAEQLANALKHNSTLATLKLSKNGIGNEGARHLANALIENSHLTMLCLSHNLIGDEGANFLISALAINITLLWLNLDDNSINAALLEKIQLLLSQNKAIAEEKNPIQRENLIVRKTKEPMVLPSLFKITLFHAEIELKIKSEEGQNYCYTQIPKELVQAIGLRPIGKVRSLVEMSLFQVRRQLEPLSKEERAQRLSECPIELVQKIGL